MFVPRKRAAAALAALGLAGCGSSSTHATSATKAKHTTTTTAAVATTGPPPAVDQLAAAERPTAGAFPAVRGRTLQQLANTVRSTATLSASTGVFTPGTRRYGVRDDIE